MRSIYQSTTLYFHLHAGYTTREGIHGNIFKGVTLNFPENGKKKEIGNLTQNLRRQNIHFVLKKMLHIDIVM